MYKESVFMRGLEQNKVELKGTISISTRHVSKMPNKNTIFSDRAALLHHCA